jgi:rod shape-determining protein MreB
MAGGGSLLSGMDDLLRQEVGLPIFLADDPLTSVAIGTGKVLEEIDLLATIELAS